MQVRVRTPFARIVRPAATVAGLFLLLASGCSMIEDRSERYVNADEGRPLKVPSSADQDRFREAMPIRSINTSESGKMYASAIPTPPDMTSEILDENYVVEELDGRVWLLVNDVPGRLWPAANAYMNQSGLGVAYDSPQLGLIQSELANFSKRARELVGLSSEPPGSAEPSTLVQLRMTPGIRRKTTEIQVRKLELATSPSEIMPWRDAQVPSAQELAFQKRLLADLADFLKQREESKSFSRAASGLVGDPRVRLISSDDEPVSIRMELDYGRSWAEVNRALTESGATVVDLNRSEGWLQVDFRSQDEREPGWFNWFGDDEAPLHTHTVTLANRERAVFVTVQQEASYAGDRSSADLLTSLFDYLY